MPLKGTGQLARGDNQAVIFILTIPCDNRVTGLTKYCDSSLFYYWEGAGDDWLKSLSEVE